ncbi:MAG: hypothetical protein LBT01_08010 [Spirochaetaceae bacterium]|jgi:hypothetical protein|nr:hypothetical protein [Spirochaetaceae bacterium]
MAKFLTKKVLVIRVIVPLLAAAAALFCALALLSGPVLGAEYDFLICRLPAPPISQEILLIETGNSGGAEHVISPALVGSVIMTLTEMSASTLIIQTPILGISTGSAANPIELIQRFDEEFKTMNANVRNLFDGIRLGAIAPAEAGRFVENVISLNERGRDRLLESAFRTSETETVELEKMFAVSGVAHLPLDLEVSIIAGSGVSGLSSLYSSGYSRPVPDSDGKIRRIAPVITNDEKETAHIIWLALKNRFEEGEFPVKLDKNGAIIFTMPDTDASFREIPLELFMEYDELDKTLYRLLSEGVSLASYGGVLPDKYPAFLYEKSVQVRENLLENTETELKERWIDSRNAYFAALGDFFSGEVEAQINASFEKLFEEEKLDEKGAERLEAIREGELQKYGIAKEIWRQLEGIRGRLGKALAASFCILGRSVIFPQAVPVPEAEAETVADIAIASPPELSGADVSALLANSLLTANSIGIASEELTGFYSVLAAFLVVLLLLKLRPALSLVLGLTATALVFWGFSYRFTRSAEWLDPIIPTSATFAAVCSSGLCAFIAHWNMSARIRRSFGAIVSKSKLRSLIKADKDLPEKRKNAFSAIIAIYNPQLTVIERKKNATIAAEAMEQFKHEVQEAFLKEDAVIISAEGSTMLVSFGSPLEQLAAETGKADSDVGGAPAETPANKAARLIARLPPPKSKSAPWYFGLDYGECSFIWSPLGRYTASGRAVVRARLLSQVSARRKIKALVSGSAKEKIDPQRTKEIVWTNERNTNQDVFFEIIQEKSP